MKRTLCLLLVLAACKSKPKSEATGSGNAPPAGDASAPADATAIDAAAVDADVPVDAAAAVVEPPTVESVHVEIGHAMRRWATNPKDRTLYAKEFGGRAEPDGRIEPVALDAWLAQLPSDPKLSFSEVKTWLEPGATLGERESKTHVGYYYAGPDRGHDDYRELVWRREDGQQRLASIKTNSRNYKAADEWRDYRNFFDLDATSLGKQLAAWFRIEGDLAWLVVANDKTQVVHDLWPAAGATCALVEPPRKDALVQLRCTGADKGQDFTVVRDKDTLAVQLRPAGEDAPMSTDRRIKLAKGAKVAIQPAPPWPTP